MTNDTNCILASSMDDTIRLIDKGTGDLLAEYIIIIILVFKNLFSHFIIISYVIILLMLIMLLLQV